MTIRDPRWAALAAFACGCLTPLAPATAQRPTPADRVQVDNPAEEADVTVPQLSLPSRKLLDQARPSASARPPAQLTRRTESRERAAQLTSERGSAPPSQLSRGGTAEQPAPLSRPNEGRTGVVAAVGGHDRCDAAARTAASPDCARVIETRSAEFARPNPLTLSPEQRLLVDQRLREQSLASRIPGTRSSDADAIDPDSAQGQVVAALALDRPGADGKDAAMNTEPGLPAAAAAVVEAILGNAGVQPPK